MIVNPAHAKGEFSGCAKRVRLFKDNQFVKEFGTFQDCAAFVGCSRSTIRRCVIHDKDFNGFTFEEGGIQ